MRRGLIFLIIFVLLLLGPAAVRYLNFYRLGGAERAEPPVYDVSAVVESVPTPAAAPFVDNPAFIGGQVLLDQSHDNAFTLDEIGYLDGRLAARGAEMVSYTGGDLATALRAVNAFVVITPLKPFSLDEIQAVEQFVRRGGRLLLLGDPTRYNVIIEEDSFSFEVIIETDKIPLNSLANAFDIIFNGDYLYNTVENEGNFRNIILTEPGFADSPLNADLTKVVLYGAHSLQVGAGAETLLAGDDNTWSSATDRPGGLTLAATGAQGQVLAIGDLQFLTEPYFTVFDNGRFIAHIADFLAEPLPRDYTVADFPFFFDENVQLIYAGSPDLGPDAFDEIITMQTSLKAVEKEISLTTAENRSGDAIYLGLYNQADDVEALLTGAGITLVIDPAILPEEAAADEGETSGESSEEPSPTQEPEPEPGTEDESTDETAVAEPEPLIRLIQSDLGQVQMSGTALILLDESEEQRSLVVLAASNAGLESAINRLLDIIPLDADDVLADCLLQENLAFCPTNVANEEVEAKLETGGVPDMPEAEAEEMAGDEPPEEPAEGEEDEAGSDDLGAIDQGPISLGETVEGTLMAEESFSWTFEEGPAVIDISVTSGEDLDAVLELYDPDNNLLEVADSEFTGGDEALVGVEIPDDGIYTILLRDFFDDGGDFALSVTEADEPGSEEGNGGSDGESTIFLFIDDDGEPISAGFTSQSQLETLLAENFTVETWVSSEDGLLTETSLETANLLIWDSGDYLEQEGFFDEDTITIFDYIDTGRPVLITGASPTLFGDIGLTTLTDIEFSGEDDLLLAGFAAGETLDLIEAYEVAAAGFLPEDLQSGSTAFLLFGPNSDEPGNVVGLASIDEFNGDQQTILLLLPFAGLPEEVQAPLLNNMLAWLGLSVP